MSDDDNCGSCGLACEDDFECKSGICGKLWFLCILFSDIFDDLVAVEPAEICEYITMPPEESMVTEVSLDPASDVTDGLLHLIIWRNLVQDSTLESVTVMGLQGNANPAVCWIFYVYFLLFSDSGPLTILGLLLPWWQLYWGTWWDRLSHAHWCQDSLRPGSL